MLMLGLVFGGWLLAAGVIALILTLVGWLIDAVKEYRKTVEADTTGHLENIPAPRTPTRAAVGHRRSCSSVASCSRPAGCRRSDANGAEGGPAPSGGPPPAASGGPPASVGATGRRPRPPT